MPYLILVIGMIVGIYALMRFFSKASPKQIKSFIHIVIIVIYCMIMLFFALTGRIIISIALLTLVIPFSISYFKGKKKERKDKGDNDDDK